jgi:hypothetical protein
MLSTGYTADAVYGADPTRQQPPAIPTGAPQHAPGTPEPIARTEKTPQERGPLHNPVVAVVVIVAAAVLVLQLTAPVDR